MTSIDLKDAYDIVAGLVRTSEEAVAKVLALYRVLRRQPIQAAHFLLWLLGVLSSVADIIPYGRLHMRPLQLFLIAQWSIASQPLCFLVRLIEVFFHHLRWWKDRHNLTYGIPLTSPKTSSTLCTDSSTTCWGATPDAGDSVSGTWTPQEAEEIINCLEMIAIYLAMTHFSSRLRGQTILIRTDNSTCVSLLKRQGGTKVPWLTYLTWKLFHLCMDHNIQLVAVHLARKLNTLADQLSRVTRPVPTEWARNSHVFRAITQKWGEPGIELFATRLNKQLLIYVSPCRDPRHQCPEYGLGHPSLPISLPFITHPSSGAAEVETGPLWPHQSWYPDLISLSMDHPLCLPQQEDVLVQELPRKYWVHPNPGLFQYQAWLLSGSTSKQQVFRRALWTELPNLRETPQDASTMPSGRNFVVGAIDGKQILSQLCALSGRVLGAFVPENSPFGH